jgi:hypothetical protein
MNEKDRVASLGLIPEQEKETLGLDEDEEEKE